MKLEPIILDKGIFFLYVNYPVNKRHSEVTDLLPAVIYYAWYGRNAWNWTWVEKYMKYGFFTDIEECKSWIEQHRVQGSVWHITQLPALCLSLKNNKQLWICSVNEKNWWSSSIFDTSKLISAISSGKLSTSVLEGCIKSEKLLTFISSKTDSFEKLSFNKKCLEWKAISYGGNYRLGWENSLKITHSYKGLKLIVEAFKKSSSVLK
jgi:hypothetical protein